MKTLFNFGFKTIKTLFILPLLVLNVLSRSFVLTLKEFKLGLTLQANETIEGVRSSYTSARRKVKSAVMLSWLVKLFFFLVTSSAISFLLCLIVNYFIILPVNITKDLNFHLGEENKSLVSRIYFETDFSGEEMCPECLRLDHVKYNIKINFEFANKNYPEDTTNYEIEMRTSTDTGELQKIRKIFYFNKFDGMLEMVSKFITLPLRVFGYFNSQNLEMALSEDLDNSSKTISMIEVYIKNNSLNIKKCILTFIPRIGHMMHIISYLKYVALPALFIVFILIQIFAVGTLYYFRKI